MKQETDDAGNGGMEPGTTGSGGFLPGLRTFSSLRNPVFRLYYGALLGQRASTNMQMIARALLIYRLTGSGAILGGMALANALPMLFLSLFGGTLADRVHKKYVLLIGQASSAAISLGIALSLTLGYLSSDRAGSWWILVAASVLQGTVMGLMVPSRQAIVPEIVGQQQLMNAIALNNLAMNSLRLFAPAVTGFLIDGFDFQAVYYAMTAMYLIAVIFIAFMPRTGKVTAGGRSVFADIIEGFQYVRRKRTILFMLVFILFVILLSRPYITLMPIFADDILKVGATGMGLLLSVSGVGAIIGAITLASLPNKKRGLMLLVGCVILGVALIGFSFSSSWYNSLALIAVVGLGHAVRMTLGNTLVQYYVDDGYRGRVMSIYAMDFGLTSLGSFGAGLLSEVVGAPWALGGFAMVLVLLSVSVLVFVPRIRNLD